MKYATNTSVPVAKTRMEIETLLLKNGATRFGVLFEGGKAIVAWSMGQWHVRFRMPLPVIEEKRFQFRDHTSAYSYRRRTKDEAARMLDQEHRSNWRALLLTIKAKLVSVESKVETFEEAFLAHIVLPGGETVGQRALPAIGHAYKTGQTPPLLGAGGAA